MPVAVGVANILRSVAVDGIADFLGAVHIAQPIGHRVAQFVDNVVYAPAPYPANEGGRGGSGVALCIGCVLREGEPLARCCGSG